MTNNQLTDLMKEVLEWIRDHECGGDDGQCLCNRYELEDRIKAALAEGLTGTGKWIQCTSESNECLGGCRSMREHDSYRQAQLMRERDEARAEVERLIPREHYVGDQTAGQNLNGYLNAIRSEVEKLTRDRDEARAAFVKRQGSENHSAEFDGVRWYDFSDGDGTYFNAGVGEIRLCVMKSRDGWQWRAKLKVETDGSASTFGDAEAAAIAAARVLR